MSVPVNASPPREGARFRAVIGLVVLIGGLACLMALYFIPVPDGNKEAVLLGVGLILGWGGTVVSYEFGSSPSGRKAADAGIKEQEHKP